jgi:hypothetical protein
MNIFKWFSAGADSAEKVLDAGIRGIDALVLTEEEKLEMHRKLGESWIELQRILGPETSIRSLTRRILAVIILGSFTTLVMGAAGVWMWYPEYAAFLLSLADSQFGYLVLAVASFYYGPEMIARVLTKK